MIFRLEPGGGGWAISVVIKELPENEHREACEPLHGGSECDFPGEYFTPGSRATDYLKSKVPGGTDDSLDNRLTLRRTRAETITAQRAEADICGALHRT